MTKDVPVPCRLAQVTHVLGFIEDYLDDLCTGGLLLEKDFAASAVKICDSVHFLREDVQKSIESDVPFSDCGDSCVNS